MRKISFVLITLCFFMASCQSKAEGLPVNQSSETKVGYSFTAEIAVYEDHARVKMMLHNQEDKPLSVTFPSSQQFEVTIKNVSGEELYRYSKGKMFAQALTNVKLQSGETKIWEATWNYDKKPFQQGEKYTVTAKLLPIEVNGQKAADDSFKKTLSYKTDDVINPTEATLDIKVKKQGSSGTYTLSGEAVSGVEQAYYAVSDGHSMLVEKTAFDISRPWRISIRIPKQQLPTNGTVVLEMYAKKKSNEAIVRKMVVLEEFRNVSSRSER